MAKYSWNKYDPHNQTPAVLLLILLTHLARERKQKNLQAYTVWNLTACLFNFSFRMTWERPLFTNSIAIFLAYRTGSVDNHKGLQIRSQLPPTKYVLADIVVHVLPPIFLGLALYRKGGFVPHQYGAFSLLGQLHFSYSLAGGLDGSKVYVPHDSLAAWISSILGHLLAPSFMNCLVAGHRARALAIWSAMCSVLFLKMMGWRRFQLPDQEDQYVPEGGAQLFPFPALCPGCGATPSCAKCGAMLANSGY